MNRIDLRQFEHTSGASPKQSLQASVIAPDPKENIHGLIEILGSTDITTQLVNIKEIARTRNETQRDFGIAGIQPPRNPEKDTLIETTGDVRIAYSRAGSEEISLALSKQGFRMVPNNTFGTG